MPGKGCATGVLLLLCAVPAFAEEGNAPAVEGALSEAVVSASPPLSAREHAWVQARAQLLVEPLEFSVRITRRGKGLIGLGLGAAALTGGAAAFSGADVPVAARRAQGLGAALLTLGEVGAIVGPEEGSLRFQLAGVYAWDASILGLCLASSSRASRVSSPTERESRAAR